MKYLLVAFCFFIGGVAYGADSDWIRIATTTDGKQSWDFKIGSYSLTNNSINDEVNSVISRKTTVNAKTKSIQVNKIYVRSVDCDAGYGRVQFFTVNDRFEFSVDYVSKDGSIASAIADSICIVYKHNANN